MSIHTIAAAAALTMALTGCAAPAEPAPVVTVTVSATPTPTPTQASPDDRFWDFVKPQLAGYDPAAAIRVGHAVCVSRAVGVSYSKLFATMSEHGLDLAQGAAIMAGATTILCPEYK